MVNGYIDTSALIKNYFDEESSHHVRQFISEINSLTTSCLTELEFLSFLERSRRAHLINSPTYNTLLSSFEKDVRYEKISLIAITPEIFRETKRIIHQHHLRAPDAIQLASCFVANKKFFNGLQFLCFDKKLLEAARWEGFKCVLFQSC